MKFPHNSDINSEIIGQKYKLEYVMRHRYTYNTDDVIIKKAHDMKLDVCHLM